MCLGVVDDSKTVTTYMGALLEARRRDDLREDPLRGLSGGRTDGDILSSGTTKICVPTEWCHLYGHETPHL